MTRFMTFALLTITLFSVTAPAQAVAPQPARSGLVHTHETALVHTAVTPAAVYAAPATPAAAPTSKPWMLLAGGVAAMALAVRRRHTY